MKPEISPKNSQEKRDFSPSQASKSEEALVRGLVNRDEGAYRTLVEDWAEKLYRIVFRFLKRPEEAQEVVQEVFQKVVEKIQTFQGDSKFSTWLYRVAANMAADSLRKRGREVFSPELMKSAATPDPTETFPDREALARALESLPPDYQLVVHLRLVEGYAPMWLAAILGAAVMAAVMASDSQILALSTMFTQDVLAFSGGRRRFGDVMQVRTGRLFVVLLTLIAYLIALRIPQSIFDVATQYAFAGYSALAPLLVAALFWRRSTKWGALAVTLWTAFAVVAVAVLQALVPAPAPGPATVLWAPGGVEALSRTPGGTAVFGFMPVVPMVLVSTNEVFNGDRTDGRGYAEFDEVGPRNPYGLSKLAGETAATAALAGRATLWVVRTAWLYGPPGADFPTKVLSRSDRLGDDDPLPMVADEIGSPTYTSDLAQGILAMAAGSPVRPRRCGSKLDR